MNDAISIQEWLSEQYGEDYDIDHWRQGSHGQPRRAHTFITGRQYPDQIKHVRLSFDNDGVTVSVRILTILDCREIHSVAIPFDSLGFLTQLVQVLEEFLSLLS